MSGKQMEELFLVVTNSGHVPDRSVRVSGPLPVLLKKGRLAFGKNHQSRIEHVHIESDCLLRRKTTVGVCDEICSRMLWMEILALAEIEKRFGRRDPCKWRVSAMAGWWFRFAVAAGKVSLDVVFSFEKAS